MLAKLAAARLAAPAAAMPAAFVDLRPTYSRDATDEGAPAPAGHAPLGLGEAFALQPVRLSAAPRAGHGGGGGRRRG